MAEHHFLLIGTLQDGKPKFRFANNQENTELFPDGLIYEDNEWLDIDEADPVIGDADELLYNTLSRALDLD